MYRNNTDMIQGGQHGGINTGRYHMIRYAYTMICQARVIVLFSYYGNFWSVTERADPVKHGSTSWDE
jgi:hypothetical protein